MERIDEIRAGKEKEAERTQGIAVLVHDDGQDLTGYELPARYDACVFPFRWWETLLIIIVYSVNAFVRLMGWI